MKYLPRIGVAAAFVFCLAFYCPAQNRDGGWSLPNARARDAVREAPAKPKTAAATPSPTPPFFDPAGEVTGKYDRFEEKTKVDLSNALVAGKHMDGLYLMAYAERPRGAVTPSTLILGFKAITPFAGAYFPTQPKLNALIDGQPAHFGSLTRLQNQDVIGVLNIEMYGVIITPDILSRLVNAKVIEMRLSTTEFKLSEHHQNLLRQFQERIQW